MVGNRTFERINMRRAAKVDGNHSQIVQGFRNAGCSVLSLAAIGKGVPDLLISFGGVTWLVEVKMPKGKLTDDQTRFLSGWTGCHAIVTDQVGIDHVVQSMLAQSMLLTKP